MVVTISRYVKSLFFKFVIMIIIISAIVLLCSINRNEKEAKQDKSTQPTYFVDNGGINGNV